MKFQCDRCQTRYSIADEKVRGKILKIRCKACEAVITLRDGAAPTVADPPAAAIMSKAVPRPATNTIELRTVGKPSTAPAPAQGGTNPRARLPELEGMPEEWYLTVDGTQVGPLSPEEAQRRVAARVPGSEIFAWRDDFTEWLPVEEVPVLAVHLPKPKPRMATAPPPFPISAAAVAVTPAPEPSRFAPLAPARELPGSDPFDARLPAPSATPPSLPALPEAPGADGFDFSIGEVSRVVKMPLMPPPSSGVRPPSLSTGGGGGLPGLAPPRSDASLNLNIVQDAGLSPEVPPPPARRRRFLVPLAIAGVVGVGALAALGFFVLRGGREPAAASAEGREDSILIDKFYTKDNPMFGRSPSGPAPAPAAETVIDVVPPPPGGDKPAPAGDKPKVPASAALRPRIVAPPPGVHLEPVGKPEPARITGAGNPGKEDSFDGSDRSAGPLTPDDVRAMYGANEVGLKRCYERALKADPTSNVTKMVVQITIGGDGKVGNIKVPETSSELSTCVAGNIRNWRFRRTGDELTTEFTVFFARRN